MRFCNTVALIYVITRSNVVRNNQEKKGFTFTATASVTARPPVLHKRHLISMPSIPTTPSTSSFHSNHHHHILQNNARSYSWSPFGRHVRRHRRRWVQPSSCSPFGTIHWRPKIFLSKVIFPPILFIRAQHLHCLGLTRAVSTFNDFFSYLCFS